MPDISRTKRYLASALKALMAERPLAKITVGDICEKCGMNRKSFYYHFQDKYDLVNWIFYTEFFDDFLNAPASGWEGLLRVCEFFEKNKAFYANALQQTGQNSFYEYFGEIITPVIRAELSQDLAQGEYGDFYVSLYADAFRLAITRWLLRGADIPAGQFVRLLYRARAGLTARVSEPQE